MKDRSSLDHGIYVPVRNRKLAAPLIEGAGPSLVEDPFAEPTVVIKWADFGITAVRYDGLGRIEELELRQDDAGTLQHAQRWRRHHIINDSKKGKTFVTLIEVSPDRFKKGLPVHIVTVEGDKYIRTDTDPVPEDHLEGPPHLSPLEW